MKKLRIFLTFFAILATASVACAQKNTSKIDVLNLECRISGKIVVSGSQYHRPGELDKVINESMSVLVGNGVISMRDDEKYFSFDMPSLMTNDEISGQISWRKGDSNYESAVVINRNSGVIRTSKVVRSDDGVRIDMNASGNCEKTSNTKKF
jgi:hypothetical protein